MRRSAFVVLIGWLAFAPLAARAAGPEHGAGHWPQFRGTNAAGVADGANLPDAWDAAAGKGVVWKTRIPGLAHSSPVVWGDQVFVTTAVSSAAQRHVQAGALRRGHRVRGHARCRSGSCSSLDRKTGKVQWQRTAYEGVPEGEAAHQGDVRERDAGHRRQARGRLLRLAGALRLRPRRHAPVEARPRPPRRRRLRRPELRVGQRPARRSSTRTW